MVKNGNKLGKSVFYKDNNHPAIQKKNFLIKLWRRHYKLVTGVVCLFVLISAYFTVIAKKIDEFYKISEDHLAKQVAEKKELEKRLSYLLSLDAQRKQISDNDINQVLTMLPGTPEIPTILASIEAIAKVSGTKLRSVAISLPKPEASTGNIQGKKANILSSNVRVAEARMVIESTPYDDVKTFLANLEKSRRILDIVSLSYDPNSQNYNVVALAYYQAE